MDQTYKNHKKLYRTLKLKRLKTIFLMSVVILNIILVFYFLMNIAGGFFLKINETPLDNLIINGEKEEVGGGGTPTLIDIVRNLIF
jgi:hypothetical protein